MYVAVKGGEQAIDNAHRLLANRRRGDSDIAELDWRSSSRQAIWSRRSSCCALSHDPDALLAPADRSTPRTCSSIDACQPPSRTCRAVNCWARRSTTPTACWISPCWPKASIPARLSIRRPRWNPARACWVCERVADITREPLEYPASRAQRLQALARGDEGFLLALGYSTQRGYGRNHPFAGEIRIGEVEVWIEPEELGFPILIGDIEITECEMVNQFVGSASEPAQFTRGYGLAFGNAERKAMGMALVDRSLRAEEFNEEIRSPAQQEEFVLAHCDNVEAAGFVSHLKLPHYVDFQSELELIRKLRKSAPNPESDQ